MAENVTQTLELEDAHGVRSLCGPRSEHLRVIEEHFDVQIGVRGNLLHLTGDPAAVAAVQHLVVQLYEMVTEGHPLYLEDVDQAAKLLLRAPDTDLRDIFFDTVYVTAKGRAITPKNLGQKRYLDAIRNSDIVFGIGPAGTGKTYLAMAMAVAALMERQVSRIILTRPAVEAGEKLGFLPGNLAEKVNPYLRPLYDALHDMMDDTKAHQLVERGTIEVAPLAFMRGRTLNDAFVILDEAQNTTSEQMKMFLTRLGFDSKAVVTGDVTQVDLPEGRRSGLSEAEKILRKVHGIQFCYFTDHDVVRHPLVQKVIRAYERYELRARAEREAREAEQVEAEERGEAEEQGEARAESDRAGPAEGNGTGGAAEDEQPAAD